MPGRPIDNERKACDAVVRALEQLAGSARMNAYSPEDHRAAAPVEYVFELDCVPYAVEHTIVEAFAGQIQTDVDFEPFIAPIVAALDHHMPPPGRFDLSFAIHPSKGIKPRDIPAAQHAIIAWVREKAADLHNECPEQPPKSHKPFGVRGFRKDAVAGVELTLHRETAWSIPANAHRRLLVSRIAPRNCDALRDERLKKAMDKKLPKLKSWKDRGARSILVLENGDISLSNPFVILTSAETALADRQNAPDELWLVDTTIKTEWTAWCLIRDGVSLPDGETRNPYWDFKPAALEVV